MTQVHRLLAPNPGPMTGPGTNTYVIVSGSRGMVIDPGPDIEAHRRAIMETLGSTSVGTVLVTHAHADHAQLSHRLAADLGAKTYGHAPQAGFVPDRRLGDGDRVRLGVVVLDVIHTPGHTPDHLCFLMRGGSERVVFTGDHIIGGSTVRVEEMIEYMRSLERMKTLGADAFLPGHGERISEPISVVDHYLAHRTERENQVLEAVRAGAGSVDAVVDSVYPKLGSPLRPAATISTRAHLRKLAAEAQVRRGEALGEAGTWSVRPEGPE